jgi:hypothetical protein
MKSYDPAFNCGACGGSTLLAAMPATLPADHFQCLHCGEIHARRHGAPTIYPSGFVMPGKITVERIPFECLAQGGSR